MSEKYNGWTNRETWLVNLHFGDDDYSIRDYVQQANGDISTVADNLESWVRDYVEEALRETHGFISDMLNLSSVNWYELAEGYVQEYWIEPTEEEEEEEEVAEREYHKKTYPLPKEEEETE